MEWISVKDKIPNERCNFLGTNGEIVFCAYWCDEINNYIVGGWESCCYCGGKNRVFFSRNDHTKKEITHWMPLPEPPK